MNFGGFYFSGPIEVLRKAGFRVVVPDQIGFGRSSKPIIPYNFHDMALNTRTLLKQLGVAKAVIFGHSMGGMTVMALADAHPELFAERVLAVGLISTSAGGLGGVERRILILQGRDQRVANQRSRC